MDAITHIQQFMGRRGYTPLQYDVVDYSYFVQLKNIDHLEIDGDNEFYFLASRTLPTGLDIDCPTHNLLIEDSTAFANAENYFMHVFEGKINISFPLGMADTLISFIRVIPDMT